MMPVMASAGGLKEIKNCDAFAASPKVQGLDQRETTANTMAPFIKQNLRRAAGMPKDQKKNLCLSIRQLIAKYADNASNFIAEASRARSAMQKLGDNTCVAEVIKDTGDIQKISNQFQMDFNQSCATQ
jgi:hypothetical protein